MSSRLYKAVQKQAEKINPKAEAKGLVGVRSGTNHVGGHLSDVPIADLQWCDADSLLLISEEVVAVQVDH